MTLHSKYHISPLAVLSRPSEIYAEVSYLTIAIYQSEVELVVHGRWCLSRENLGLHKPENGSEKEHCRGGDWGTLKLQSPFKLQYLDFSAS